MPLLGTNAAWLLGDSAEAWNFSCDTNNLTFTANVPPLEYLTLCSTGLQYEPFLPSGTIETQGYYSGSGAGYIEKEVYDRLGTSTATYVTALYGTNATKAAAYTIHSTWGSQMTVEAPVDNLITLNSAWTEQTTYRGWRIFSGTISATGDQTSVDFGSAGSSGGYAYLYVTTITGSATNAAVKIQSSSNDSTFADEGTFTFSNKSCQVVTMSGTVNRYLRLSCTSMGGATSFVVQGVACVYGVTYQIT